MPTINVRLAVLESSKSENVTGARFTIEYTNGRHAEISMMHLPSMSGAPPFEDFRAEVVQLAKAIQDAVQSPDNIKWYRRGAD